MATFRLVLQRDRTCSLGRWTFWQTRGNAVFYTLGLFLFILLFAHSVVHHAVIVARRRGADRSFVMCGSWLVGFLRAAQFAITIVIAIGSAHAVLFGGGWETCAATSGIVGVRMAREVIRETIDGMNKSVIVFRAVMFPCTHNCVVITSPIGVHAPPALAATTTTAPNSQRSSGSATSSRSRDKMKIVDVRL